jgi:protein NirF
MIRAALLAIMALLGVDDSAASVACPTRGTGDLALVVERESGSVLVFDTSEHRLLSRVAGLGDLSHASAVFSRDQRYAFVFGRDGGLTKVDLLCGRIEHRVVQAGNSIGGAISADGRLVAVANYEPGGVKVFDSKTLELIADIPAEMDGGDRRSKVVGLVDAPGRRFLYALYDAGELGMVAIDGAGQPKVTRFERAGSQPYDALITPDGRHYIAGLFGEDGLALLDLWYPERGVRRILDGYGRGAEPLPVYKMPHLEGWAIAGRRAFFPAVGHHELLVADMTDWTLEARIPVAGQPVFAVGRPGGRQVWVNFALPHNDRLQIIDTERLSVVATLTPGKGVLHMEFSPRGEEVWVSVRDANRIEVYDAESFAVLATLEAASPSGIFFASRATRIGS